MKRSTSVLVLGAALGGPVACSLAFDVDALGGGRGDASVSEDGPIEDAGSEPEPRFCATVLPVPSLCADFDEGPLAEGFDNALLNPDPGLAGGGRIAAGIDPPDSVHSTRFAEFSVPALGAGANATAYLSKRLKTIPRDLWFYGEIRVADDAISPSKPGRAILFDLELGAAAVVVVSDPALVLDVFDENGNPLPPIPLRQELPVGVWKQLGVHFVNRPGEAGPDGRVDVYIDGLHAARATVPAALQSIDAPATVVFGITAALGPIEALRVSFDNVRIYW